MPKSKSQGKGLKKKLGPFPVYFYLVVGGLILAIYLYYRHRNSSGTSTFAGSENQTVIPSGVVVPSSSGATTDNSGTTTQGYSLSDVLNAIQDSGITSNPVSYPSDYVTQTDFQSGVQDLKDQVSADIASVTFPQPNINITVPPSTVHSSTTASKTAAKKSAASSAPKTIRYYTYKKDVPLKAGQTLHFASGKGYYAK